MKRRDVVLLASTLFNIFAVIQSGMCAATSHSKLMVKLNYTGAGIVDENHKIYVLLFDTNPFTASSLVDSTSDATPPAATAGVSHILRRFSASRRDGTITFDFLRSPAVYAAAFVDRNGSYDGHSDPASGAPMGLYRRAPDKIEPIRLKNGKSVKVVLAFDDSSKTP
jgi:hypothetical protein